MLSLWEWKDPAPNPLYSCWEYKVQKQSFRLLMALSAAGGALAFLAVISLRAQTPGPSLGVGIRQCKQQESDAAKSGDSSALQTDA